MFTIAAIYRSPRIIKNDFIYIALSQHSTKNIMDNSRAAAAAVRCVRRVLSSLSVCVWNAATLSLPPLCLDEAENINWFVNCHSSQTLDGFLFQILFIYFYYYIFITLVRAFYSICAYIRTKRKQTVYPVCFFVLWIIYFVVCWMSRQKCIQSNPVIIEHR